MPLNVASHIDPSFAEDTTTLNLHNAIALVAKVYEFEDIAEAVGKVDGHARFKAILMLSERYKQEAEYRKQNLEKTINVLLVKLRQGGTLSEDENKQFVNESAQLAALTSYINELEQLNTTNKPPFSLSTSTFNRNPLELLAQLLAYREIRIHFPKDNILTIQYNNFCAELHERLIQDQKGFLYPSDEQKARRTALEPVISALQNHSESIFSVPENTTEFAKDLQLQYQNAIRKRGDNVEVNWQNAKTLFPALFPPVLGQVIKQVEKYTQAMIKKVEIHGDDLDKLFQEKLREVTKQAHELTFELTATSTVEEKDEVYKVLDELYEASCTYWTVLSREISSKKGTPPELDPLLIHEQQCSQAIFAPLFARIASKEVLKPQVAMIENEQDLASYESSKDEEIKCAVQYRKLQLISQAITKGQLPKNSVNKNDYNLVSPEALKAVNVQALTHHGNLFTNTLASANSIYAITIACSTVCKSVGEYLSRDDQKQIREQILALLQRQADEAKDQLTNPAHIEVINKATSAKTVNFYIKDIKFYSAEGKAEIAQCAKQKRWALFKETLIINMASQGLHIAARARVKQMAEKEWENTENKSPSNKEIFERDITGRYHSIFRDKKVEFKLDELVTKNTGGLIFAFWSKLIERISKYSSGTVITRIDSEILWDDFVVPQEANDRLSVFSAITAAPDVVTSPARISFIEENWIGKKLSELDEEFLAQSASLDLLLHQKLRILCGIHIAPIKIQDDKLEYNTDLRNALADKLNARESLNWQQLDVLLQAVKRYYPQTTLLHLKINHKLQKMLDVTHPNLLASQWAIYTLSIDPNTDKDLKIFLTALSAAVKEVKNNDDFKNAILATLVNALENNVDINKLYKLFRLLNPNSSAQSHQQKTIKEMMTLSGAWDKALLLLKAKGAILKVERKPDPQSDNISKKEEELFNTHKNWNMGGATTTADVLAGEKPWSFSLWERSHAGKQPVDFFKDRYEDCAKVYRPR